MRMSSSSSEYQRNENAFEGIAPCSLSDACVQSPEYPTYDVFINHRGPDTKETLAALIYKHLSAFDLCVFLDQNEFRTGDFLPEVIQAALATCTVHVAIFSPRYAESQWCLAELSYMLTTRATILPIFYDLKPSHLRDIHTGPYAKAFQKHQEKQRIDLAIVQKWKQDLYNVSFISGIGFDTSKDDQAMLLKRIVDRVVEVTKGEVLDVAKYPIGLDEALEEFQNTVSKSDEQFTGYAKLVGIVGIGGSGKTTLAKKIYNEKCSAYKGRCCFLSDVRSEANKSGLTSLQSRLLQKLLHYDWKIDSIKQGIQLMRSRLKDEKVLLVLDDVDNVDQIDALLVKDVLGPESLIILTSRAKGVLSNSGVLIFHKVKRLRESQARKLFCLHAFLLPYPLKEFETLVDKFLKACSGLPLLLKVIGALLYNKKDLCYWNGTLEKIGKRILPGNIFDSLKVSFDALDMEEKETFLDIAWFSAGEEKNKLIGKRDGSGWSGMQNLENLEQKCLVEFAHQNQGYENKGGDRILVRMHDHLRDIGRSVIQNQSQPSRLWRAPCSLSDGCVQSPEYPAYDVFINHMEPDTKETLVDLIYKHLSAFELRVFFDQNEFQTADFLPPVIQAALATCTVHVAIFSPSFAESQRCLAELSYILTTGATIIPIFYDLEPFHLRYIQTGPYAQALQKHQEKQTIDPEIVQKWKQDLYNVSFISGIVFNTSKGDQAMLLKSIVDRVIEVTKGEVLDVAKHPIGLDEALEEFQNTVSNSDEQYTGYATLVGIIGMGGSGKTTLAKKVYNERSSVYKGCCCFLSDVRSEANKSGLTSLQSKLLQKLLHYDWKIDSISQGIQMIKNRLGNQKVLLVLDDVDHVDQIDALLPKDVLGPGSLVILTSRDKGVLLSSDVLIFHEVKGLKESHARELFCWHAFLLPSPLKEFEALVGEFLIACSGLPLSLNVIGALLFNKDICYWKGILETIGKHKGNIVDTLKVSFDALDREEKEIFLDIACFFAGEEKNKLMRIWDGSGWTSMQSLENLQHKCLVEFAHQNEGYKHMGEDSISVGMHDHLRDLGRSVIENQSQPSRLWRPDDIRNYLSRIQHENEMVTEVRGICGSPAPATDTKGPWSSSSVVAARALKLLQAEGDFIFTEFNYLLRHLVWLRWCDFGNANIPSQLYVPNLRVLELIDVDCNLMTMWQDENEAPTQLRELYVQTKISSFTELPKSTGLLRNLEKIVLQYGKMTTLPDELCQLPMLNYLNLSDCENLQSLPSGFGNLKNLRHLDLTRCKGLQALPNSFSQLIQLQYLALLGCESLMISTDILRNIVTLEYLDLTSNIQETLPTHITNQRLLTNLHVNCPLLKELPANMEDLCNLRVLEVLSDTMTALPSSLTNLTSLKSLTLFICPSLQCLPESIAQLQALEYLSLNETAIEVLPEGVAHLRNLVELDLSSSPLVDIMLSNSREEERPLSLGNPLPVHSLAKAMISLKSINMVATETTKLCIATDVCPNLEILTISYCKCLIQVEALPKKLVHLQFYRCDRLKKVQGLQNLTRLRDFNITGCFNLQELGDLSESKSLELLKADGCFMLTKMQGLQPLQRLKQVRMAVCTADIWTGIKCLKELPSKLCTIHLNMQTVGAEETEVYEILNSMQFPISVLDFEFCYSGAECEVKLSEVRSCSGLILILLLESGERVCDPMHSLLAMGSDYVFVSMKSECQWIFLSMFTQGSMFLRDLKKIETEDDNGLGGGMSYIDLDGDMPSSKQKGWVVLFKDKEEWKMTEIWEKLFSYAYSKRAFKDEGHSGK